MIEAANVTFRYVDPDTEQEEALSPPALRGVNLRIAEGEFVALLGRNGSGKSSLARLLNAIELPTEGEVRIDGLRTADKGTSAPIRRAVQIVFQNPENQQVGLTVGEDIAFGLSNIGWPQADIAARAQWAADLAGLAADPDRLVSALSGGEKQKLALASVLALSPRCLVLDESTSMLDPAARRQFVESLQAARSRERFTLIYITHHVEEVLDADRWILFDAGQIVADDTPERLTGQQELLEACGLELPFSHSLAYWLRQNGVPASSKLHLEELRNLLCTSS